MARARQGLFQTHWPPKRPRRTPSFAVAAPQPLRTRWALASPLSEALPPLIYDQVQPQCPGLGKSQQDQLISRSPPLQPCSPLPPCPFPRRGVRLSVPAGKVTRTRAGRLHWSVNGGSVFAFITNPLKTGWLSPGQDQLNVQLILSSWQPPERETTPCLTLQVRSAGSSRR